MKQWIKHLVLPNFIDNPNLDISKQQFKNQVKKALAEECQKELKEQTLISKKLKDGPMRDELFEKRKYFDELSLSNARHNFKFRSQMFEAKFNYKHQQNYAEELWRCSSCLSSIDTQSHVLFCPA